MYHDLASRDGEFARCVPWATPPGSYFDPRVLLADAAVAGIMNESPFRDPRDPPRPSHDAEPRGATQEHLAAYG
jgi:hypothetical protein